jgi:hypothetical protein
MNKVLMEHIAHQILAGLGIISSPYFDNSHYRSLISKEFLLDRKLHFKAEDGSTISNNVYGCQMTIAQKSFKILLGDCSQDRDIPEYCLIIHLQDNPVYGLYMICNPKVDSETMIAVTVNHQHWMICSTFLQATFLAAMEQLRDIGLGWSKCTDYQKMYELMVSMIQFHDAHSETEDEGQEVRS